MRSRFTAMPETDRIRILVADDHPVVRCGLRQIIDAAGDMLVAAEACTGREALEQGRRVQHDLVLLDLLMPDSSGLDVLKQLKAERPATPVLILTMYSENQLAIRALRAGASGYLPKESAAEDLEKAVRKVFAGGRYLTSSLAERLADYLAVDPGRPLHEGLSDREYQVMLLIAGGNSTREVSVQLGLSIKTIATYRARLFAKMRVKSAAELGAYAVRNALIAAGRQQP